ncbi:MAG: hypothetical protein MSC30_14670 [Gaiellaceae bacterium MAG52_C11]|nr:hypothetical protein [Candidatus Gaiellasilicea maunaloa]
MEVPVSTGFVYDERCLSHDNGSMFLDATARSWLDVPHYERPERLTRTFQVLERSGALDHLSRVPARAATEDGACQQRTHAAVGPEARVGPDSWESALVAVGGMLAALDAVVSGAVGNTYVLLRPPGHHASADQAMGFCLFNAVAVAARAAQRRHGFERIAIIDWDVHHGNGTEAIFYEDPSVLFISLHQDGLYPFGSGDVHRTGEGAGEGRTVNVPLPPGSGDDGDLHAFDRVVGPVLTSFRPHLVLVSAGQDPAASDPLRRMSVTAEGFRGLTARVKQVAQNACDGRLILYQEGGYSLDHLPLCTLAIVEELAGIDATFAVDPTELDVPPSLGSGERAAVDTAAMALRDWWPV